MKNKVVPYLFEPEKRINDFIVNTSRLLTIII